MVASPVALVCCVILMGKSRGQALVEKCCPLFFACGSFSFPMPEWSSSLYAVFFSFRCRHSRHSLQRFCWSSSRWQIATAVFSNAPRRSSSLTNNHAETAIGNPTCDTSWAQSMPRPVRRYPGSGSTVRARSPSRRQWWRTSSWR